MSQNIARRTFLRYATAGVGAAFIGSLGREAYGANALPLLDAVKASCARLAPLGWRDLLLAATGGELDIGAADLRQELLKPLTAIQRGLAGFGDFSTAGTRAVTPGQPDLSLLYHAFASATVVARPDARELGGFPTLAEIESLENFIYGVAAPTLDELRQRANGKPLGLVVFALHYRNTPDSVHGRHAELCFARSGVARVGSIEPLYDARKRMFVNVDPIRPFEFRVTPQRFAAYLAVRMPGEPAGFGPQDALPGDEQLQFWVPLHKLFSGAECLMGMNLDLNYSRGLQNEELAQFHKFLDLQGHQNNWRGEHLEQFPFTIKNEKIGSLQERGEHGPVVLAPRHTAMTEVARYQDNLLTFPVYPNQAKDLQMSSLFVIPGVTIPNVPAYEDDAEQEAQRQQPEYTNVRHRVNDNGTVDNLNLLEDMTEIIHKGGYQALHYIDFTGDGWVAAHCPQLQGLIQHQQPAYCMVGLPDFFPNITQRDLMLWSERSLPPQVSKALWVIRPLTLSQTRIAANVTLPVGFSIKDVTITAIVGQFGSAAAGPVQTPNGPLMRGKVGLPDGSPGLFDPGWDTSQGIQYTVMGDPASPASTLEKFLAGYSLGSPFIEDAKLCAALGSYWPGVAPDATRTFQPGKRIGGKPYPWPTVVPLTDQEIGSAPLANGNYMPWDGVRGPTLQTIKGVRTAVYPNIFRTDYIDLIGTMTAALTAQIDGDEYKARVLAMETVYWNLGIRDDAIGLSCHVGEQVSRKPRRRKLSAQQDQVNRILRCKAAWAVLSFEAGHQGARAAAKPGRGGKAGTPRTYHFHVFRWDPLNPELPHPTDLDKVLVTMLEEVYFRIVGTQVWTHKGDGRWVPGTALPT
ncbi:hypothetical protein [Janthinobacterium fluminis]|uniref:Uncharacterized protein n=1 Tax=Janthinobacterium fluminis TaxID=2987524 RepID=A0ABT5K4U5_9BURK|nr:hypothetical protein [Janthinobacterium fluminis]MDC8760008.1 hypothetical protein [Janthinobacterium fluminis]